MTPTPRSRVAHCAALLAGFLPLASPARAQSAANVSPLQPMRVDEPPRLEWFVDGTNGIAHEPGASVADFRQREPGDGAPVSETTTAFLSYDQGHLYVVFVCRDDPAAVRANVAKREDIGADDGVAVYLDTFMDRERTYVFMVNPLGVQLDGIVTEGQSDDYTFDTVWESEGHLTSDGYVVRIAIPFRSLRFPRRPEQVWGIALERVIRRRNEKAFWPHVTKRVHGFVPQFGVLDGLRDISPGRNVELLPYGVAAQARVFDESAASYRTDGDERVGMDAKVVVRDALTLDATVNPDFSQVESDDPQVTVNERFEVFFPEKRPFFLENSGFFQTPINLFFSRRIVDPGVGTRVTGKLGRWVLGAIAINDREPGRRPADDPLAGESSGIGAVRLQREIGQESTVGVLVTDRELARNSARTLAVDTRWKLNRNWVASGQIVASQAGAVDGRRHTGNGAFARIDRKGRHLEYSGRYVGFTPDFAAPLGFVRRVGFHQTEQEWEYKWRPDHSRILSFGPKAEALFNWDRSGRLQDRELAASFELELTRATQIQFGRTEAFERFHGLSFEPHVSEVSIGTKWLKWLAIDATYARGTAVNHDPAQGLDAFLANATETEVKVTVRPMPRLRLDQAWVASGLETADTSIFTERRLRTKLTYQFTRLLSLRAIVDYQTVVPDAVLTDEDRERKWSGDFLLTYLVHPGTAVHLGYIDRYEDLSFAASDRRGALGTGGPMTSVGRQVFAKISYLFRL